MALIKGLNNSAQAMNSIMNSMGREPLRTAPTKSQKSERRRQAANPEAVYARMSLPKW